MGKVKLKQLLLDVYSDPPNNSVSIDYSVSKGTINKHVSVGRFASTSSVRLRELNGPPPGQRELARLWNLGRLLGNVPTVNRSLERPTLKIVDFFCGCGGLSLGIKQAAEAVGLRPVFQLAMDVFEPGLSIYERNIRPLRILKQNFEVLLDYEFRIQGGIHVTDTDSIQLSEDIGFLAGKVDVFIAGPPCEGNSNLNNKTRRSDSRNELYVLAVAAGIRLEADVIIIENVPTVRNALQDVIKRSMNLLRDSGYVVDRNGFTLKASDFGTPQDRRRHFLIASKADRVVSKGDFASLTIEAPTVKEAIIDLMDVGGDTTFDQPSQISPENQNRVEYLDEHKLLDLPDEERPDCHRLKDHTYPAVYGRMDPNKFAPTITTGFLSPGRGRFTHPFSARSLTPHEGARLQGFPEDFDWLQESGKIGRMAYASMIGDAVPPQLGFAVGLAGISLL